jgi:hypothetical protein
MELFIRIVDGEPFEHPILGANFRQAFPNIDTNNLPPEFARFERIPTPSLVYATLNNPQPTYQWAGGVVKDVWDVTPMSSEEVFAKQQATKDAWAQNGFASWIFNEDTCVFDPPVPYPIGNKPHIWEESTTSWVEVTNA